MFVSNLDQWPHSLIAEFECRSDEQTLQASIAVVIIFAIERNMADFAKTFRWMFRLRMNTNERTYTLRPYTDGEQRESYIGSCCRLYICNCYLVSKIERVVQFRSVSALVVRTLATVLRFVCIQCLLGASTAVCACVMRAYVPVRAQLANEHRPAVYLLLHALGARVSMWYCARVPCSVCSHWTTYIVLKWCQWVIVKPN